MKISVGFSIILFVLLFSACTYRNNSIYLFADADPQPDDVTNNPDFIAGNIPNLLLAPTDRYTLNRIFERKVSFREVNWHTIQDNRDYLIVLRPAYYASTIKKACRSAEVFYQENGKDRKFAITGCRNKNGQWNLISSDPKER